MCVAKAESPAKARAALLPVGPDQRSPMREIYQMFRGTMTPEAILKAAGTEPSSRFFAELYVGLYYDAMGDRATSDRAPAPRRRQGLRERRRLHAPGRGTAPAASPIPEAYQITRTTPAPRMSASRRQQRKIQRTRGRADQQIERITTEAQLVADADLLGGHVERLIGRVAEEIVEEAAHGAPQVHARHTRQQAHFPHDDGRHVDHRLLTLASFEHGGGLGAQPAAAGGVKEDRVRVGDGGREISHGASSAIQRP